MTPKERIETALNLGIPDEVPTFELEFQLEEEFFGRPFWDSFYFNDEYKRMTFKEKEKRIIEDARYFYRVFDELDYGIVPAGQSPFAWEFMGNGIVTDELKLFLDTLHEENKGKRMIATHGDGTFAIPDGDKMYDFAYDMVDRPEELKEQANREALAAIDRNKKLANLGVDVLLLCSDYCFNSGPFLSPEAFGEFIQPYLARIIEEAKKEGLYTIKHTDGNIMPILNQLVECKPHALHSIDPMAGVDIKEVKRLVGDKVCLCGNVHCAALQTGTEQDVIDSAEYCLTHGKEGGGYIFCTSNIPFKGMPADRYKLVLDIWKRMRKY